MTPAPAMNRAQRRAEKFKRGRVRREQAAVVVAELNRRLGDMLPIGSSTRINLLLGAQSTIEAEGDPNRWGRLAEALDMTYALATLGIGDDYLPEIEVAKGAWRAAKAQGYTYTQQQRADITYALQVHEEQLKLAPVATVEAALRGLEEEKIPGLLKEIKSGTV